MKYLFLFNVLRAAVYSLKRTAGACLNHFKVETLYG